MDRAEYAELRAFAAIAEVGSFVRAAGHLGVSASALSQTIRSLEARVGLRLLNRTTRSVALSEAGERLLSRLAPTLADLDRVYDDVQHMRDKPAGRLRINTTRIAANERLAPLLGPFLEACPDVSLDVVVDDRLVDIVAGGFDAGVRLGERVEKDMIAVPLGAEMEMLVVASPGYLRWHGRPQSPRDLRHHRCINYRRPTDGHLYRWELEREGEKLEVSVDGPLIVSEAEMVARAVIDGAGIGYVFGHLARPEIAAGRMEAVLTDWTPPFPGFHIYYPSGRQMRPALRAFIDFARRRRAA